MTIVADNAMIDKKATNHDDDTRYDITCKKNDHSDDQYDKNADDEACYDAYANDEAGHDNYGYYIDVNHQTVDDYNDDDQYDNGQDYKSDNGGKVETMDHDPVIDLTDLVSTCVPDYQLGREAVMKNEPEHRSGTLCNMRGSYVRSNFLTLYGSTITWKCHQILH